MKKKIVVLFGVIMLIGSLCACAENTSANESESQVSGQQNVVKEEQNESKEEANNTAETSATDYPEGLSHLYTENRFGYSIRLLPDYNTEKGYGYASYEAVDGKLSRVTSEVIYVTQYSGEVGDEEQLERIDMSQYEDSTDIFDLLIWNIDHELFSAMGENLIDYSVEIIETKEINGVEMTKFEGEIKTFYVDLKEEYTYPIVAYGIKSSKTPVLVSCIDRTEDFSRHEIWVDRIDDVVSTFQDAE